MTLLRKDSAKFSKSKLLSSYNDIDIYIEDTAKGYSKIYVNIFKRVFNGKYVINDIYPIGPRGSVIKKCVDKSTSVTRPTLFVVDGDLYLLRGEPTPLPNGVFRLPFYCVENLILDSKAILKYLDEEHVSLREDQIELELSYKSWKAICEKPLMELFIVYAIVQKLNITGLKNVSIPITEFIDPEDDSVIKEDLIEEKINEIEHSITSAISSDEYIKIKNQISKNIDNGQCMISTYVSGKDYLYPLLYSKICKILNRSVSHINLKQRLAMGCDISKLMDSHNSVLE